MAPPLDWTITAYSQTWTGQGFYIQVTTDVPCTLYLLWTTIPPRLHLRALNKRGLPMMDDPYYCFVQWNRIEQWVAGDAKHHSFFLGDWKPGEYRWFVFVATIEGLMSPSTSPIFLARLAIGPVAAPIIAPYKTILHVPIAPTATITAYHIERISAQAAHARITASYRFDITLSPFTAQIRASYTITIRRILHIATIEAHPDTEVS